MQKNRELSEMSSRVTESHIEVRKREEKIFELENQLIDCRSKMDNT